VFLLPIKKTVNNLALWSLKPLDKKCWLIVLLTHPTVSFMKVQSSTSSLFRSHILALSSDDRRLTLLLGSWDLLIAGWDLHECHLYVCGLKSSSFNRWRGKIESQKSSRMARHRDVCMLQVNTVNCDEAQGRKGGRWGRSKKRKEVGNDNSFSSIVSKTTSCQCPKKT
jgi:hypothetical protein